MKFSKGTMSVLKNYATINPSIIFKPGDVISTVSALETIFSRAQVKDTFDEDFAIYDLSRFLGTLSLFKETPEIVMGTGQLNIKSGKQRAKYTLAEPSMLKGVAKAYRTITLKDIIATLRLKDDLTTIIKASGTMQLPDCVFSSDGSKLFCCLSDSKNPTSDIFEIEVEGTASKEFEIKIKVENIKLLDGVDYTIQVPDNKRALHFSGVSEEVNIDYWFAAEQ